MFNKIIIGDSDFLIIHLTKTLIGNKHKIREININFLNIPQYIYTPEQELEDRSYFVSVDTDLSKGIYDRIIFHNFPYFTCHLNHVNFSCDYKVGDCLTNKELNLLRFHVGIFIKQIKYTTRYNNGKNSLKEQISNNFKYEVIEPGKTFTYGIMDVLSIQVKRTDQYTFRIERLNGLNLKSLPLKYIFNDQSGYMRFCIDDCDKFSRLVLTSNIDINYSTSCDNCILPNTIRVHTDTIIYKCDLEDVLNKSKQAVLNYYNLLGEL